MAAISEILALHGGDRLTVYLGFGISTAKCRRHGPESQSEEIPIRTNCLGAHKEAWRTILTPFCHLFWQCRRVSTGSFSCPSCSVPVCCPRSHTTQLEPWYPGGSRSAAAAAQTLPRRTVRARFPMAVSPTSGRREATMRVRRTRKHLGLQSRATLLWATPSALSPSWG